MIRNRHIRLIFIQAFLLVFTGMSFLKVHGQVYGNEWIVPGQSYFKIPVGQTGIYAIPFSELTTAGVPASFLAAQENLQLFHRGVEQAIHISNDSLIFYGQMNDGTLDSLLYDPNGKQPHKYYNLYSDTAAYFLTWSASAIGKRMLVQSPVSAVTPEVYHKAEVLSLFTDVYEQGYRYSAETYMTFGDQGEGWFSGGINDGTDFTYSMNLSNVYASGSDADFEIMLVGKNGDPSALYHVIDVLIGNPASPDVTFSIPAFAYHDVRVFKGQIPLSSLSGSSVTVTVRNKGNAFLRPSKVAVAYTKLTYPQTFNMGVSQKYFTLLPNVSFSSIEISNPSLGARVFDITNRDNVEIPAISLQAGMLNATLATSASGRQLYVSSPSAFLKPSTVKQVDLSFYSNSATAEYIIISHRKIMTGAREYAAYRASGSGGTYDTLLVDVEKLYNLYSYGERTPVAIRRFLTHLFDVGAPQYLFIIGKGLSINYGSYRKNPGIYINDPNPDYNREDLVPCFGVPCSDLLFSMGLNGALKHIPALPTGRLPAKSDNEVRVYLDKIKENETTPNALWRKNILHLSGGKSEGEKTTFYNHMVLLKNIAEDTVYGGKVVRIFSKKGNDAVDNELISSVSEEINKGVSYVTFLGHSSAGVTDLDIGFVSQEIYGYNNKGKYPMLFINGCQAALMFTRWSFAEDWILTPDKGAILTLGHTDAGYAQELQNYSSIFYKNAFQKRALKGMPVGDVQLAAITDFYNQYTANNVFPIGPIAATTIQQMVIQGDPAVRVYRPDLPDYETNDSQLAIKSIDNKGIVTAVSDSFAVSIVVSNLGVDLGDSLQISVKRTINGQVFNYGPVTYKHVSYQDTLLFVIKSKDVATYGQNIFEVTLDPGSLISEMDEFNNTATINYFMPLSGVSALFPKEYSIVSSSPVTFIAQSTNLMVGTTDYFIELDTSYLFNSSALVRKSAVVNAGALVKWEDVALPVLEDSLVYYWRVRYNNIAIGQDTLWGESSFIYIDQSPSGWSQSEFPQFLKDNVFRIDRDETQRKWNFATSSTVINIRTVGNSYVSGDPLFTNPYQSTTIQLNGYTYEFRNFSLCAAHALFAISFDRNTAAPYSPYGNSEGGVTCGIHSTDIVNYFNGMSDSTSAATFGGVQNQANLMEYIDNVSNGDYIVLGNSGEVTYDNWSSVLKNKIKTEFGAKYLDSLSNGMTYLLVARKGDPDPVYENYGSPTGEIIHKDTLYGIFDKAYITSTLIGPAASWGTFYRTVEVPEVSDKYLMKIIGVNIEGNNVDTLTIAQNDTLDLSTVFTLDQYPYIRLLAEVKDTALLTAPQLKKWQVIYGGVPEGTMNPSIIGFNEYNTISREEGDSISICYAFENISDYDFTDTLQVKYTITNSLKGPSSTTAKLARLKQDSVITFCYKFSTKGFQGSNVLQAYVNPKILKEEYYNNNIVEMSFNVQKDNVHPVLDVVVDGVHIMDGDIVSPNPMITVTLNDENKYLIRNSTDDIELFLQKPGDATPQKVDFTSPDIINARQVGGNGKNSYQIDYNPKNLPDGIYTLVVRAKDLSENASGTQDYRITFEVINESAITNFYPYPNPFSTSTRFVFTLTGSEIPQDMKIQIMTVTGKVVREITKAELGPIRIGNNKTEYAWDGTDEFGDKLANGVYLYRVVLKNGADFKHRETAGDRAFKKNFGKLYILR